MARYLFAGLAVLLIVMSVRLFVTPTPVAETTKSNLALAQDLMLGDGPVWFFNDRAQQTYSVSEVQTSFPSLNEEQARIYVDAYSATRAKHAALLREAYAEALSEVLTKDELEQLIAVYRHPAYQRAAAKKDEVERVYFDKTRGLHQEITREFQAILRSEGVFIR